MPDRKKVISGLGHCSSSDGCDGCPYSYSESDTGHVCSFNCIRDALALLKEQDDCENCAITIEDRQPVVRCKDCKFGERTANLASAPAWYQKECEYKCTLSEYEGLYDYHSADWFCADGQPR